MTRMASCSCGRSEPSNSEGLAFFESRAEGSKIATEICTCGYALIAHTEHRITCPTFVARGPWPTDIYYCGCRGWD